MQPNIHPDYQLVIFHDTSANQSFLIRSTYQTKARMKWEDGNEYPVCYLDTSSASHPFYTGKQQINKAQGQVAKFNSRFKISSKDRANSEAK
ncbi:type B 50S ribosomal protein L31 [Motilimonas pumila]|uniref:Large ribosomal subunit protein bL31B n=1 Tax=Motilimonas pumila TaxID=2303987 RepID=A0A418YFB4_9GAMM|nr:type B 50S ribosomal protein L31 [Motilimonas pumila]RJG47957.1 type B 50S ribosomal protein L31 [Motilimonas pumila]